MLEVEMYSDCTTLLEDTKRRLAGGQNIVNRWEFRGNFYIVWRL